MNIDLVKLFPQAAKVKGYDKLVINYFDIVQFETRTKNKPGYNSSQHKETSQALDEKEPNNKEHKLFLREGMRHDFPVVTGDDGIAILTALRYSFNIMDGWSSNKDTLQGDARADWERRFLHAQSFVTWAARKYI